MSPFFVYFLTDLHINAFALMPKTDKLFELIHALTPGEKKACKLHLHALNLSDRYKLLYDTILNTDVPSNDHIQLALSEHTWSSRIRPLKSELYRILINFLVSRRKLKSDRHKLEESLDKISLFLELGLREEADKEISRIEKTELLQEHADVYIRLLALKLEHLSTWESKGLKEKHEKIKFDFEAARAAEHHQFLVRYSASGMLIHMRMHQTEMDDAAMNALDQLAEECFDLWEKSQNSEQLRLLSRSLGMYYKGTGQNESAFEIQDRLFSESKSEFTRGERSLKGHLMDLTNYANIAMRKDMETFIPPILEYFESLHPVSKSDMGEYLQDLYTIKLLYHLNSPNFSIEKSELDGMRNNIHSYSRWMVEGMIKAVLYNLGLAHFFEQRFGKALECFNDILSRKSEHRIDLNKRALVFSTFCHFELGNHDIHESLFRSAYNYCRKGKHLHPAEEIALKLLRSLRSTADKRQLKSILGKTQTQLSEATGSAARISLYVTGEIRRWIDEKLESL